MQPPVLSRRIPIVFSVLLAIAAAAGCMDARRRYENVRFGFSVPVPAGADVTESDNGDGASFLLPDRPALVIRVWGGHDVWGLKDLDALRRFYRTLDAVAYADPRPARLGDLPAVEYTTSEGGLFSRQRLARHDARIYGLSVSAPPARRAEAEALLDRLAAGFDLP